MIRPVLYLTLILLFVKSICSAQKVVLDNIENVNASTFKSFTIELETKKKYSTSTHFRYIQVIDQRADKSKMGIVRGGDKPENRKIIFPKDFTPYVQER